MSRFMRKDLASLQAYTPGEQPQDRRYIKLNTNESPFPPCEAVKEAAAAEAEKLNLYPDPDGGRLKGLLTEQYGVPEEQIFLSNGSDDILNFAFMAFCDAGRPAVFPDISYGFYQVFADLHRIPAVVLPLLPDFTVDVEAFLAQKGMAVIANPNSPTGIALPAEEIEGILAADPERLVLVDEAYVDFGAESCLPLLKKYDNLLVVQTFSKYRSLAGARLGFAFGSPDVIRDLETIRYSTNPYNVNRMTLAAGIAALKNAEYDRENGRKIQKNRAMTEEALKKLGFEMTRSSANFLFVRPPVGDGKDYYLGMKERGVLVRVYGNERIRNYVRVTIGDEEQMAGFLRATEDYLKGAGHERG